MAWSPERQTETSATGPGWWTSRPTYDPVQGAGWFNRPGAQPVGATASLTVTVTASAALTATILMDCQQTVTASTTVNVLYPPGVGFPFEFPITFSAAPKLVIPEPAASTLQPHTPGIPERVIPAAAALLMDQSTPIVLALQTIIPEPESLTAAGSAATVVTPIPPTPRTFAVNGSAPTVTTGEQFPYVFPLKL